MAEITSTTRRTIYGHVVTLFVNGVQAIRSPNLPTYREAQQWADRVSQAISDTLSERH